MISISQPTLGKEELNSLEMVFASNRIGKGEITKEFEKQFAAHIMTRSDLVCTTNCCTEGLFSSMYIMDIKHGDEVILPTISFIGAANAVCANGSKMVLCDVNPRTLNLTPDDIEKVITKKSKAILLLHYGGIPCDMDGIMDLAKTYSLKVIEDCAAGVCSSYKGRSLGTIGDMGMWSFDAMKILVSGDGACLHFNKAELKEKAEKWLYFGLETLCGKPNAVDDKWWDFDISCYGHRAIMNDITSAIALEQLKKLPEYMEKRRKIHDYYNESLKSVSWIDLPLAIPEFCETSYYFYHIQLKNKERDNLAKYLRTNGINTTYRYFPIHRIPKYQVRGSYPNADYAADHTLCIPIHQSLSSIQLEYISEKIIEFGKMKNL